MGPSQLYYTVIALEWQHQLLDTFYEIADKKHTIFPLSYLHETNECPPFFHSFPRRFLAWNLPPRHHSRSRRYSHVCRLLSLNFNCIVVQFASYIRFTLLFSIERPTYYVSIELKFNQYDGARIYRHCLALLKHEQNTPSIRHFASFLWSILDCSVVNGLQWWHFTLNDEDNNCMCVTNTDFQYYWLLLFFFLLFENSFLTYGRSKFVSRGLLLNIPRQKDQETIFLPHIRAKIGWQTNVPAQNVWLNIWTKRICRNELPQNRWKSYSDNNFFHVFFTLFSISRWQQKYWLN